MEKPKRENFSSGIAVFFATLGSALGLGNMWKFPYLVGNNGGGAFLFVYLICVFLLGIPVMISEFFIGRHTRKNAIGAFTELKANPFWKCIGYMGILSSLFIMFFYTDVAGWVYSYVFRGIKGDFNILSSLESTKAANTTQSIFLNTTGAGNSAINPMIWQLIVLVVVSLIIIAGVKKGIEKVTKTLLPILFILVIICDIRALTLQGSKEGLNFLFNPDFSKLNGSSIMTAMGLAFFKLSLGMGTMITYASYFTNDNNLMRTPIKVALSDIMVSLLAGIAIFPVVFSFGIKPEGSGMGLLFTTVPLIFMKLPFGNLLLIAFFFLTAIAATTALISLLEVPVAFLSEELKINRTKSVIIISSIVLIVGILTVHPGSLFGNAMIGSRNLFDFYDFLTSNILMPLGGFLIALFVGYVVNKNTLYQTLSNNGTLNIAVSFKLYQFVIRYITPILVLLVFLNSLQIITF